ncbi:MAG: type II toxin-antitoxin system RelE/ParE family toxin [Candidatus Baltobacteraceae bacterium]
MIRTFRDGATEKVFNGVSVPKFAAFEKVAIRRLFQLEAATALVDLKGPGLQLEKLKGNREGQHSIHINDRYRVCFVWKNGHAFEVEIADPH